MAEMLLKNEIKLHKIDTVSVSSAGVFAFPGNPPDRKMVDYLTEMGVPIGTHRSRQIKKGDVDSADLILVMEHNHKRIIEQLWPEVKAKVKLLGKFGPDSQFPEEIADPYGGSPSDYRLVQSQILLASRSLFKKLTHNHSKVRNEKNQDNSR